MVFEWHRWVRRHQWIVNFNQLTRNNYQFFVVRLHFQLVSKMKRGSLVKMRILFIFSALFHNKIRLQMCVVWQNSKLLTSVKEWIQWIKTKLLTQNRFSTKSKVFQTKTSLPHKNPHVSFIFSSHQHSCTSSLKSRKYCLSLTWFYPELRHPSTVA